MTRLAPPTRKPALPTEKPGKELLLPKAAGTEGLVPAGRVRYASDSEAKIMLACASVAGFFAIAPVILWLMPALMIAIGLLAGAYSFAEAGGAALFLLPAAAITAGLFLMRGYARIIEERPVTLGPRAFWIAAASFEFAGLALFGTLAFGGAILALAPVAYFVLTTTVTLRAAIKEYRDRREAPPRMLPGEADPMMVTV